MKDKIFGNSTFSPCKDCPDRKPGCHSAECPHGWEDFQKKLRDEKHKRYKENNHERRATRHEVDSKERTLKRQGKK